MADWRIAALACLLLAAARTPPIPGAIRDGAGNWSLHLQQATPAPGGDPDRPGRACTVDGPWCAELSRDGEGGAWRLDIFEEGGAARRVELSGQMDGEAEFGLWPRLTREAGGAALIAVRRTRSTGFSGGGASATDFVLIRAEPGAAPPREVLDLPLSGRAMIRACFGARDERARAGACHDEYELAGDVRFDVSNREGRPRFVLIANARTYPGARSRTEDSTAAPRLRRSDLVWAGDEGCSYRRVLSYDAASGRYRPDSPLPDCPNYFDF